jgi:hypothetical protein
MSSTKPKLWVDLPEAYETEPDAYGYYDKVYFKHNEKGQLVKVTTPYRRTVIRTRIYQAAKNRRESLKPFGLAAEGNEGTTLIGDEVFIEPVESYTEETDKKDQDNTSKKQAKHEEAELPTLEELLREADAKNQPQGEVYKPKTSWCYKTKEELDMPEKPSATKYVPRFKRHSLTDNSKLFVGNIAEDTHEDEIWEAFSAYGRIKNVFIPKNKMDPEINKGFCFVTYYDEKAALEALNGLHRKPIGGMIVDIKIADSKNR